MKKALLAESFGQRLLDIFMWNNHITKALPCINTQQFAAKTISKDQQPLRNIDIISLEQIVLEKERLGDFKVSRLAFYFYLKCY